MPEFDLLGLLLIRARYGARVECVQVGIWSRAWRTLVRAGLVHEAGLPDLVGRLTGCRVAMISHEQGEDYPARHLAAMAAVVPGTLCLREVLKRDPWVGKLARLIGNEPALAFALQQVAHTVVWPQLLQLRAGCPRTGARLLAVAPACWSGSVLEAITQASSGTEFFRWPRALTGLSRLTGALMAQLQVLVGSVGRVLRTGLRFRPAEGPLRNLATELIEPSRLNRGPYDADFLVDGKRLAPADLLLFLTGEQERRLRRKGVDFSALERQVEMNGYGLARLAHTPLPVSALRTIIASWFYGLAGGLISPWAHVYVDGARRYLEFAGLFGSYRCANVLYLKFPNGDTSWRTDSAVVTGLARAHGSRCAGLQNRVVYAALHEFAFDCYDRFFSWGPAWYDALAPAMAWVGQVDHIGCIYLDGALLTGTASSVASAPVEDYVLVFTGDTGGSHYTFDYNVWFLEACQQLAEVHPGLEFRVKCKDPEHADIFEASSRLRKREVPNLSYVRQSRHNYRSLLDGAVAVISIGFTTPGVEALLLGKPSIYLSGLRGGGEAFVEYPGWVADSAAGLKDAFARAWVRREGADELLTRALDALDGFRDGRATDRLSRALFI